MLQTPSSPRQRILFIGEAVTLAHVVRPVVLAQALDPQQYVVTLACDPRYHRLFATLPFERRSIRTISSAQFVDNITNARPAYDTATLRDYVREDLQLIEAVKPALVVGDFRLSLAVSSRVAGVPYFTITNAYWSPYSRLPFPMPELPMIRLFGVTVSQALFTLVRPLLFVYNTLPLNRIRREYGLPGLGYNLREIYTHADQTLYADIPHLVPTAPLPPNHHWLGPILWSPAVEPPAWWSALPENRPIIYVTLGSSGEGDLLLPIVLQSLAELPVTVIAATAGRFMPTQVPANAYLAAFLPGTEAAARSTLVICNGGSPTTQQALAAGVPVLGIAGNVDQHLNMICLERTGAGVRLRSGQLTAERLRASVEKMLQDEGYRQGAGKLMQIMQGHDTGRTFVERVAAQLGLGNPPKPLV